MPTITVNATVTALGALVNSATVSSPEVDPVPGNNTATATVTGSNSADMSITKTGAANAVFIGDDFSYVLTPRNNGPVALPIGTVVQVTDPVPAGITIRVGADEHRQFLDVHRARRAAVSHCRPGHGDLHAHVDGRDRQRGFACRQYVATFENRP